MRPQLSVIALAVAYPLLVLAGTVSSMGTLRAAGLVALMLAVVLPGLLGGNRNSWLVAAAGLAGCAWLIRQGSTQLALLVAPVVIPAGVAWIFGRTLLPGRCALIEQLVRHLHADGPPADEARLRYARRLTVAWTTLLAALAATNAALGFLVTPGGFCELLGGRSPLPVASRTWAAFTGIIGYAIVGGFFVVEYLYRQRRFPAQPYDGFRDFLSRSLAAAPALALGRPPAARTRTPESDA